MRGQVSGRSMGDHGPANRCTGGFGTAPTRGLEVVSVRGELIGRRGGFVRLLGYRARRWTLRLRAALTSTTRSPVPFRQARNIRSHQRTLRNGTAQGPRISHSRPSGLLTQCPWKRRRADITKSASSHRPGTVCRPNRQINSTPLPMTLRVRPRSVRTGPLGRYEPRNCTVARSQTSAGLRRTSLNGSLTP
jgi:hypothetical protein